MVTFNCSRCRVQVEAPDPSNSTEFQLCSTCFALLESVPVSGTPEREVFDVLTEGLPDTGVVDRAYAARRLVELWRTGALKVASC